MKHCPECKQVYADQTLNFCLEDGAPLIYDAGAGEAPTAVLEGVSEELTRRFDPKSPLASSELRRLVGRRPGILLALGVALIVVLGYAAYRYLFPTDGQGIRSIAVMPFTNDSGSPELDYLSDGMTESLISSLSQLPNLSVKARSSVFRYKGTAADPQTAGRDLGVQAVLTGRIVQRGDAMTLYLELVDVATGNQIWGSPYSRKQSDLMALQNDVVRDVADRLRVKLTAPERQSLAKNYTANSDAYRLYLKGRYYWYKLPGKEFDKSRAFYQEAIAIDPSYALAYAGLAEYYGYGAATGLLPPTDENWSLSEQAARKALQLDPRLPSALNALAGVKQFSRDRAGAKQDLEQALEIDPGYAEGHRHYAALLTEEGRFDEAASRIQKAVEIEPMSAPFSRQLAILYFRARQYDKAADQCRETLSLDPNDAVTHELLGNVYEQKGLQKEAIAEWARSLTLRGKDAEAADLDRAFAASGFAAALRLLWEKKLADLREESERGEFVPAADFALAYARLGEREQALNWIEKVANERNALFVGVKLDPFYDALRPEPRFQAAMQRINSAL